MRNIIDEERRRLAIHAVGRVFSSGGEAGSGLLLPERWFLTSHHVIETLPANIDSETGNIQPTHFDRDTKLDQHSVTFGYEKRADGTIYGGINVRLSQHYYASDSRIGEDWILIQLIPTDHEQRPLIEIQGYPLGDENLSDMIDRIASKAPNESREAEIFHHPLGDPKHTSIVRMKSAGRKLEYEAETLPGSSGGPIVDELGRLIGIHRQVGGGVDIRVVIEWLQRFNPQLLAVLRAPDSSIITKVLASRTSSTPVSRSFQWMFVFAATVCMLFFIPFLMKAPRPSAIHLTDIKAATLLNSDSLLNNSIDTLLLQKSKGQMNLAVTALTDLIQESEPPYDWALTCNLEDAQIHVAATAEYYTSGVFEYDELLDTKPAGLTTRPVTICSRTPHMRPPFRIRLLIGVKLKADVKTQLTPEDFGRTLTFTRRSP